MPIPGVRAVCGAKKRDGSPCQNAAMPNGRCRLHGGKSPVGVASGTFRTGKYSKSIPARLAEQYDELRQSENRLHMGDEIALLDARVSDLLDKTDHGESGELWKAVQEAAIAVRDTQDIPADHADAIDSLLMIVEQGHDDWRTWGEIRDTLESKRKLADTEIKRVATAHKIVTQEQGLALIGRIQSIVLQYVPDDHNRRELARAFAGLTD